MKLKLFFFFGDTIETPFMDNDMYEIGEADRERRLNPIIHIYLKKRYIINKKKPLGK